MEHEGSFSVKKRPLLDPILTEMNPDLILETYFFKIHSNIIRNLRLALSSGFFLLSLATKILHAFLTSTIRATCITHPILLDFITLVIFGE